MHPESLSHPTPAPQSKGRCTPACAADTSHMPPSPPSKRRRVDGAASPTDRLRTAIGDELDAQSASLRFCHRLELVCRTRDECAAGIVVAADGVLEGFAPGGGASFVRDALRARGIDPEAFAALRPLLMLVEWPGVRVYAGNLRPPYAAVLEDLRTEAAAQPAPARPDVTLTFASRPLPLEPLPLPHPVGLSASLRFKKHVGCVVDGGAEGSGGGAFAEGVTRALRERDGEAVAAAAAAAYRSDVVVHAVGGRCLDTGNPAHALAAACGRAPRAGDLRRDVRMSVRAALHVDSASPDVRQLFEQALPVAAALVMAGQAALEVAGGADGQPVPREVFDEAAARGAETMAAALDLYSRADVVATARQVANAALRAGKGASVDLAAEAEAQIEHSLVRGTLQVRRAQAKLAGFRGTLAKEADAIAAAGATMTVFYIAGSAKRVWDPKTQPCAVCAVVGCTEKHAGQRVVYGRVHNIDFSKSAPVSHILEKLGWRSWSTTELALHPLLHKRRLHALYPSGRVEMAFRAVMTDEVFERLHVKLNALSDGYKRHVSVDSDGSCIRNEWGQVKRSEGKKKKLPK